MPRYRILDAGTRIYKGAGQRREEGMDISISISNNNFSNLSLRFSFLLILYQPIGDVLYGFRILLTVLLFERMTQVLSLWTV